MIKCERRELPSKVSYKSHFIFYSLQSEICPCFPGGRKLRNTSGRLPENPGGLAVVYNVQSRVISLNVTASHMSSLFTNRLNSCGLSAVSLEDVWRTLYSFRLVTTTGSRSAYVLGHQVC